MNRSSFLYGSTVFVVLGAVVAAESSAAGAPDDIGGSHTDKLAEIQHIVVIYQENHSFDNLYGGWEGVNGRGNADPAHAIQVGQAGVPYTCLLQNDFSLTSPPLPADCADTSTATAFTSHFPNAPFQIDTFIPVSAQTCPKPSAGTNALPPSPDNLPGGCTRDLVHRFYQEQYQLDGGKVFQ